MKMDWMRGKWTRLWDWIRDIPEPEAWRIALVLWLLLAVIAGTIVAIQPDRRTVTPEYRGASEKWWNSEETIYRGKSGFLYLPHAAIFYTPYTVLPERVGEPLWRWTMLGMLAFSLAAACRRFAPDRQALMFLVATLLVIPSALASARNGQVNMPLGALYLLTAVALADRKWWWVAGFLVFSLALKPVSMVPILLVGVCYPATRLPLLVGLGVLFAVAFIHPSQEYVWGQYREFVESLLRSGRPSQHLYCDIAGMFQTFHLPLPEPVSFGLRILFALLTLWVSLRALRVGDSIRAAFLVLFFSAIYLMLFNPRTETNSYIILGVFVGIWGAYEGVVAGRLKAAAWLFVLALSLGTENYGNPIFPWTNLWQKALFTSIAGGYLALQVFRTPVGDNAIMLPPQQANPAPMK